MNVETKRNMIAKAKDVVIHSGNVLHKVLMNSEEICDSFCGTLEKWVKSENENAVAYQPSANQLFISCENCGIDQKREDLKISTKIFLRNLEPEVVEKAVRDVLLELKCGHLDSIVISFPPSFGKKSCDGSTFRSISFHQIEKVWNTLESLVEEGLIKMLGVCDFDAESLQDLYKQAKTKPSTNQVNLVNCCTPPDDLTAFAGENDIRLFTHNDPEDILPPNMLQFVVTNIGSNGNWNASYLARYSCVVRRREVVKSKGYFLCLHKDA